MSIVSNDILETRKASSPPAPKRGCEQTARRRRRPRVTAVATTQSSQMGCAASKPEAIAPTGSFSTSTPASVSPKKALANLPETAAPKIVTADDEEAAKERARSAKLQKMDDEIMKLKLESEKMEKEEAQKSKDEIKLYDLISPEALGKRKSVPPHIFPGCGAYNHFAFSRQTVAHFRTCRELPRRV
jgi:hypothetical protein